MELVLCCVGISSGECVFTNARGEPCREKERKKRREEGEGDRVKINDDRW